jgi:preprotein translocase subunit SecD
VVENRVNGLGVSEAVVQQAGEDRILVELPGETDPETALQTIRETGLLEWVDTGSYAPPVGTELQTDYDLPEGAETEGTVYHTIMTGANIEDVGVSTDEAGRIVVGFSLDNDGRDIFAEHTRTHVGQILALVLDGVVISSPQINSAIPFLAISTTNLLTISLFSFVPALYRLGLKSLKVAQSARPSARTHSKKVLSLE